MRKLICTLQVSQKSSAVYLAELFYFQLVPKPPQKTAFSTNKLYPQKNNTKKQFLSLNITTTQLPIFLPIVSSKRYYNKTKVSKQNNLHKRIKTKQPA
ncbi:MAG: hypothetical protein B6I36_08275 [Desulfobacteraceae bacterium 4572_35.1]|nr:MAG: hypothetical protein B6I36_08275 [Desulfobacteraceae bacterium 4572_35.1]